MKFQLTTLVAILCFHVSAFSMFDCDCSWEMDMVCIQTDEGTIIPFPNACWAECMGYDEDDFVDCSFDINYDPTCGCSFETDPVCVVANTGEVVLFPNSCWAECIGYTEDSFLNCNYDLPTMPSCGCDFTLDEVCVEVDEGIFMPFPNPCWANCMGYFEDQFVDCDEVSDEDLVETAEYLYEIITEEGDDFGEENVEEINQFPNYPNGSSYTSEQDYHISGLKAFPNPFDDRFYLILDLNSSIAIHIDIVSSDGKTHKSLIQHAAKGKQVINIDVRDLPGGLYAIRVYAGQDSQSLKLVKK